MAILPAPRTIWKRLKDPASYLSLHPIAHRSTLFEELVVQSFASLLHLPFYDRDTDNPSIHHKVTWFGSKNLMRKASPGADGIGHAYEYSIVIEATLKTGANQLAQEFGQCLRHAETVSADHGISEENLFTVLVTRTIYEDTYHTTKNYNDNNSYKILPIELAPLTTIIETAFLAFTMRHTEVRRSFRELLEILSSSHNRQDYQDKAKNYAVSWQKQILELEKATVVAVKSYEAMQKIGRDFVGVTEILQRLKKHPTMNWYFGRLGEQVNLETVSKSLLQESLGVLVTRVPSTGEKLFSPVPLADFKSRCKRRLQAIKNISSPGSSH